MTVPLCRPSLSKREEEALLSVLRSGHLVAGPWVERLELGLSNRLAQRPALAVSNGTSALHLALLALGVGPGDEVIVPSLTYPAPVNVVDQLGATPILVDVERDTACMDPVKVREALTSRTRVILPVHQFGISADMTGILGAIHGHGVQIVEDAACALGTSWKGTPCGAFGEYACFSFHPRKVITGGEGGAVVAANEELAERIRRLRNHGQTHGPNLIDRFVETGLNQRMSDLHASVAAMQLDQIDFFIQRRADLAALYAERLAKVEGATILPGLLREGSVVQSLVTVLDAGVKRAQVFQNMREQGVEVTIASYGIHQLPVWRDTHSSAQYPNAERLHTRGMTLPLFPAMTDDDVCQVVDVLKEAIQGAKE